MLENQPLQTNEQPNLRFLSCNALKIIAAISMLLDHVGFLFFPTVAFFRVIGRLAFPLFAFTLAEGARYTRNKWKRFAMLFGLAVICQLVYYFFADSLYMCVLVTFSFSTLLIYTLQAAQQNLVQKKPLVSAVFVVIFALGIVGTYFFCKKFVVDYGFFGCLLPVFVSLVDFKSIPALAKHTNLEHYLRVSLAAVGLVLIALFESGGLGNIQWYSLCSLVLLLLYNGKKGKGNLKSFFYIFYPTHLALLQGIVFLMQML